MVYITNSRLICYCGRFLSLTKSKGVVEYALNTFIQYIFVVIMYLKVFKARIFDSKYIFTAIYFKYNDKVK